MLCMAAGVRREVRKREKWAVPERKWGFTHPIIELWVCHCYWR